MADYELHKGDRIEFKAKEACKVRVEDIGSLVFIEVFDLIETKRADAQRLLDEADKLEQLSKGGI